MEYNTRGWDFKKGFDQKIVPVEQGINLQLFHSPVGTAVANNWCTILSWSVLWNIILNYFPDLTLVTKGDQSTKPHLFSITGL